MADTTIDEVSPLIFYTSHIPIPTDHRTPFQKRRAVWLILLAVAFERLAFYSLTGNLVLFLTSDHICWTSLHSITASFIFFGTSYISAIIFSWISDAKLGRAKTILIGFVLYTIGYVFIPLFSQSKIYEALCGQPPSRKSESVSYYQETCSSQITSALVLTAIGVGAVQSNMAIFGAEQIREQKDTTQYFNKYYVAVNTGCLFAFGIIAYIQQNISYVLGYSISTGLLGVTLLLFLMGYRYYFHIKPNDSVITNFFPVLINAFQTWRKLRRYARGIANGHESSNQTQFSSDQDEIIDHVLFKMNEKSISFFDYAKGTNNGRFQDRVVDDIKSLRRIIVMFLLLIPYWLIYLQLDTTFIVQGVHMRIPVFPSDLHTMPVVWLSISDQIIVILIIFILNACVYKRLLANNRPFSIRIRIVLGMISATLAMCIAGTVEIFRQNKCDSFYYQNISNTLYNASDMSIFYQFPQYISIGLSEVFASVASLEFAYLAAPQSAQSLVMSLRFCSAGLSSFMGSAYISIYESVYKNFTATATECKDTEKPELSYIYFFVLAGIQVIFIFIFLGCDRKFEILKTSQHRFNTRLFIGPNSKTSTT